MTGQNEQVARGLLLPPEENDHLFRQWNMWCATIKWVIIITCKISNGDCRTLWSYQYLFISKMTLKIFSDSQEFIQIRRGRLPFDFHWQLGFWLRVLWFSSYMSCVRGTFLWLFFSLCNLSGLYKKDVLITKCLSCDSDRPTYDTCIYTMFLYCNLMLYLDVTKKSFTCYTKEFRVHSVK